MTLIQLYFLHIFSIHVNKINTACLPFIPLYTLSEEKNTSWYRNKCSLRQLLKQWQPASCHSQLLHSGNLMSGSCRRKGYTPGGDELAVRVVSETDLRTSGMGTQQCQGKKPKRQLRKRAGAKQWRHGSCRGSGCRSGLKWGSWDTGRGGPSGGWSETLCPAGDSGLCRSTAAKMHLSCFRRHENSAKCHPVTEILHRVLSQL